MAKKDTMKALIRRGISEEATALLLTKYGTLGEISEATAEEIEDLGISSAEAETIVSALSKHPSRSTVSKAKKEIEEVPAFEAKEITRERVRTPEQERLIGMAEAKGYDFPIKILTDIASRTAGNDIDDETCGRLLDRAWEMYTSHLMDQNESAGVMVAHSIGEPGTQMNMRTFHYAGVANINVTQGLPRLIEIVDARRVPSTPSMQIPLVGIAAEDESAARHVAADIEMTALIDVADLKTDVSNMRLIITPNAHKMDKRGVTIDDMLEKLNKIRAVRGMVEKSGFSIVITSDVQSFKKLQVMHDAVKNAKIKGIDGITRAVLSKNRRNGKFEIITEGSNLKEVLKVRGVDAPNVMTNSILEIADVLGIEAARNSIIYEAGGTLGEAGLDVDIRHIMLVADLMTNDGSVKAIGRHGVSGRKSSVLARAAFEITAAHLLHAAMVGEVDHLEGVTENIIVGQPVTLGTGAVNLIYTPKNKEGDKE
ncbi:MAG: DNA-directed RNA polymerase subunit A'' [Candidatus Methanomethylophilaceae archaeon]|jgi:DNA-directed RNA polymerase subunit A"